MATTNPFNEQVSQCATRLSESGIAALSGLFDLTSQRLVRYAATLTRNQHDAEDAVQAALVQIAKHTTSFCNADQPWPYLLRVVRNEALTIMRRKKRWSLVGSLSDLLTRRSVDEVEQEESHRAIWLALRSLPAAQAEVIVLKIWEDMTFAQIGSILNVSTFTAGSRYRYGMEKLAHKLNHQVEVTCE